MGFIIDPKLTDEPDPREGDSISGVGPGVEAEVGLTSDAVAGVLEATDEAAEETGVASTSTGEESPLTGVVALSTELSPWRGGSRGAGVPALPISTSGSSSPLTRLTRLRKLWVILFPMPPADGPVPDPVCSLLAITALLLFQ
ncbi:MAG: hypothetical protein FWG15_07195 [Propionibacteriaceae bacterium]|nr:hypothetical protein [Propionibacteriaceae bacterium]